MLGLKSFDGGPDRAGMSTMRMVVGKKSNSEPWVPKRGKEMKSAHVI